MRKLKKYSVLMIDLKNSRSYNIQDRNNIQNSILSGINILNKIFKNSIEKEVEFSAGDEIQGLFISSQSAYLYYRLFSMLIFPIQIHTGIGFGTLFMFLLNGVFIKFFHKKIPISIEILSPRRYIQKH